MIHPFTKNNQIDIVTSFEALINYNFNEEINALCWERDLEGNFKEVVDKLTLEDNITEISAVDLKKLELTESGIIARDIILNDLKLLTEFGASPSLNLLKFYDRDAEFDFISTDVYSWHVDRSPIATDTFLCTYHGAASDIVQNSQARKKIEIPEINQKLRQLFDGPDQEFENFLSENYFDLHYQLDEDATPINLGIKNLWRLAVDHPTQNVLPCIHRAPFEADGEFRLLLIC